MGPSTLFLSHQLDLNISRPDTYISGTIQVGDLQSTILVGEFRPRGIVLLAADRYFNSLRLRSTARNGDIRERKTVFV
jgi:hypothetical protein